MIFPRCAPRTRAGAEGISFLLIDMRSPGVEVRPIITLDGEHEVNEVFFSNVRVPAANLVGEENRGWTCAKYLLTYERTNIAGVGQSTAARRLKAVAARQRRNGRPLADDPDFAARRAGGDRTGQHAHHQPARGGRRRGERRGAESSMLKIRGTLIRQEITALNRRAMGPYAGSATAGRCMAPTRPSGRTAPTPPRRNTSTTASCRSSAAPMKSRKTSSPR